MMLPRSAFPILLITALLFLNIGGISAQPKREFRAAWVATVVRLDWPSSTHPSSQRQELRTLFNQLASRGINAVIFQVRPECDAFYDSAYEPWSYWLTGKQGSAPNPYYDPLQFAVEEAHNRKMELHAWFNPYRAERSIGSFSLDASHVVISQPDWILTFPQVNLKLLNPGLPQVRQYVTDVVMDVVNRYDVDGIHFDDYFYPYPSGSFNGISTEDTATFTAYSRGQSDIGEWRRENVNLLVEQIYDSIYAVKPHVKFGISPFGIWKNGEPPGISGLDAYNVIYGDAIAWLQSQTIDYVTPQLYWPFGGGQDYGLLLPWWALNTNGRHLYPGQAAYRINRWTATEMPEQIRLNRQTDNVYGSVFFRAKSGITNNPKGFADSLQHNFYKYPSLMPTMVWKDDINPITPVNLQATNISEGTQLSWQKPPVATDGDSASQFVIYRSEVEGEFDSDDPQYILHISDGNNLTYIDESGMQNEIYRYYISSLDRLHNESVLSDPVTLPFTSIKETQTQIPGTYVLDQNYPNPFNPSTTIRFKIGIRERVHLSVFDMLGRRLAVLVDKELDAGVHYVTFNASSLSSGIYFYRLETNNFSQIKKMTVLK